MPEKRPSEDEEKLEDRRMYKPSPSREPTAKSQAEICKFGHPIVKGTNSFKALGIKPNFKKKG